MGRITVLDVARIVLAGYGLYILITGNIPAYTAIYF